MEGTVFEGMSGEGYRIYNRKKEASEASERLNRRTYGLEHLVMRVGVWA